MSELLSLDIATLTEVVGYPGIFAIIFAESGALFAPFLPGASLLFAAGVLAAFDVFKIQILLPVVLAAAILGDSVGYWIGKKVGEALFARPDSRFFKREYLEQTKDFFRKYGSRTIVVARFIPIVRTFAPIMAGVGGMRYNTFLFYNVLGAFLWGGGMTLFGFFLGKHLPNAETYIAPIALAIIIITILPLIFQGVRTWKERQKPPRVVLFDLDGTLAPASEKLSPEIAEQFSSLLTKVPVALLSGARMDRIERDFLPSLPQGARLENLYIFPETCARGFRYANGWHLVYEHSIDEKERADALRILEEGVRAEGLDREPLTGERILSSAFQISYTGTGMDASAQEKEVWDPRREKRGRLKKRIDAALTELGLESRIVARTTMDITKKGVDKAIGVWWLSKHLSIAPRDMLFVGDEFGKNGNDTPVLKTGIQTREVANSRETLVVIQALLKVLSRS
jgi:membrane-associated protein